MMMHNGGKVTGNSKALQLQARKAQQLSPGNFTEGISSSNIKKALR